MALPVAAEGLAGAYLAARQASSDSDFAAASRYYTRALVKDPTNISLLENAIFSYVGQGDAERGAVVARRLQGLTDTNQVANLVMLAQLIGQDNFEAAFATLEKGQTVGPLVDGLALAWIQIGQGNMSEALGSFEQVATETGLQSFGLYHKALALGMVGDMEGADEILSGRTGTVLPATIRGVIAHAEILSQLDKNELAIELIDDVLAKTSVASLTDYRGRLSDGETLPFNSARNAKDGVAEVFFTVAGALTGEANDAYTLIYSRMAEYLRPDHVDSILLSAKLLENMGQYELATDALNRITRDNPAFLAAEIGRADTLDLSGNTDAAIEVLQQLSESHADEPSVHVELGNILRGLERFDESAAAYDRAVALFENPEAQQWVVYFARGITHERMDRWEQAEADFLTALELNPDQPRVMNYLGYSYVEKRIKLPEALDLIERAVAARPKDGYVTDSLGWILYRLGRYQEAVGYMETAVELMAVDPIINDHLGDVYWAVGRKREAEFQWSRALSFEPEEDEAERIRRKLEVGLDQVLSEEGAEPISLANDG
ncbi:MAG: tetratricopeptide repeat protein [Marinosulfonomonas sp.]|nr:tetratricopeptide repeat protein [Marinosulfonomonas sp.]